MRKKRFAVITGTRAEYGLLYPLIQEINKDTEIDMDLIVTGSHLAESYGKTISFIESDGIKIDHTVDMEIQGDKETEICSSIAIGLEKFSDTLERYSFDGLIILGDRYELLAVCTAAIIHRVPIIHINGGEVTEGAIDDAIRHAITKMASIHFPSLNIYKKRIIQMGENPKRVHLVGSLAMDNMKNINLMTQEEISEYTKINFAKKVALMTYHPVTLNSLEESTKEVQEIMEALLETDLITLITMPNADAGSQKIYNKMLDYIEKNSNKFYLRNNLGQRGYLSVMKHAKLMIGNSSSGIGESPYFKIGVVNVGERQKGRFRTPNIVDCQGHKQDILNNIKWVLSEEFQQKVKNMQNPYGEGDTAKKIVQVLRQTDFRNKEALLKKGFYDLI
ncbi:UDP-N-acetylglucosamine 2-epimerase [Clostridium formicaceticum]|uniref:GDP/UDP-N,N'-diacetylbacillosamine 2-epimerase (Hydrolyzing) n=1 Tax=Clostridium formicaceticum TaxID=1497 RepID=A0AAC9RHM2_9CLOT|nr:UDP-N-acetylglucosamine 2-epimerase [Clostridium formicaceticum]AOY75657.1 UDP-N-acetyl-D-glucosamine 2-epimerase, UDP-hydrolysing [Clostridium formicaceticum]ARE85972.1 GDP/UDP-N,N'-diacetylbacillosamine 2-epimerase (hydrolyzing) [Clostridium formicaceticum]